MVDTNTNENSARTMSFFNALSKFQKAMEGEAERAGIFTEDDVVALVKEVRAELAAERSHNTKGAT